jgi:hypothetical protein
MAVQGHILIPAHFHLSVMVVLVKHVAVRTTKPFRVWRQAMVDPRVLKQLGVCVVVTVFVTVLCWLSAK